MSPFDAVFIGSSPGMLLEAILSARQGHNTALIYPEDMLGGAWKGLQIFDEIDIESAPHFFQSHVELDFLNSEIDLNLMPVSKTKWLVKFKGLQFRCNDRLAKIFLQLITILSYLLRITKRNLKQVNDDRQYDLMGACKELWFLLFVYREARYYFKGGCVRFNQQLAALALKHQVTFITGKVQHLNVKKRNLILTLNHHQVFETQRLFITRRTVIDAIETENQVYHTQHFPLIRNQIHLHLFFPEKNRIYLHRSSGCGFFAVADLSLIENSQISGRESLITLTHENMSTELSESNFDLQDYFRHLLNLKVFPSGTQLQKYQISHYYDQRMHDRDYQYLNKLRPESIHLVGNIDLSIWLKSIAKRWISKHV